MVSATIRRRPRRCRGRSADAGEIEAARLGKIARRNSSPSVMYRRYGPHLDRLGDRRRAGPGQRVEVDPGRTHPSAFRNSFCALVDAEPEDDQRDRRQMRHVAHHLERGVGEAWPRAATGRWRARRRSRCCRRSGSRSRRARTRPRCCARARRRAAAPAGEQRRRSAPAAPASARSR